MSNNNITTEFILAEDGKFYKRTACTTVIKNASDVLASVKEEGVSFLCPLQHPMILETEGVAKHSVITKIMYRTERPHLLHIFTRLPFFPFPDNAYIVKHPLNNYYGFQVGSRATYDTVDEDVRGMWGPVRYQPETQGLSLFSYCCYNSENQEFSDLRIFVVDNDMNPYTINVANVFDDGRLCAGNDYDRTCGVASVLAGYHKNLQTMFVSPCNNDLRNGVAEQEHLRFDNDRKQILTLSEKGVITPNDHIFYIPMTNESVLEFCKLYGN